MSQKNYRCACSCGKEWVEHETISNPRSCPACGRNVNCEKFN